MQHSRAYYGLALVSSWQVNIYDMLRCYPPISIWDMNAYFGSIDSKVTVNGNLLNGAPILFQEQFGSANDMF